ncbi:DNA mismatch repair protein [Echinicola jeungdonensis]|uniref:DNA mismatch repair protein n=1 Tax=Echinicola jeungdonensis TaxID=709343 RepID=A0ABV5J285_9BACT|nr:DNA mismatch repair protein [Echinicola jeungdonensis]MDN3669057.1 DNA mismatch repair protein [Echinicola jeungdonensis]
MTIDFDATQPSRELRACKQKIAGMALARLIVFFVLAAVLIVGLSEVRWLLILFFPLSALFIYFILLFNEQKDKEAFLNALLEMEGQKEKRKKRDLKEFEQGITFKEKQHPFCDDLDLFGQHSLFQLINHTVNEGGQRRLAEWMKASTNPTKARQRNQAIHELTEKEDFIRNFEAIGKAFIKKEKSKRSFYKWLNTRSSWKKSYLIPMIIGPMGGLLFLMAWLLGDFSSAYLGVWILIGFGFLGLVFKPLMMAAKAMPNEGDLKTFSAWANELEHIDFKNLYLKDLQSPVFDMDFKASKALKSLEQQSFMVLNRGNMIYLIFNLLFWVDIFVLWRLERWKDKHAPHIKNWEEVFEKWQVMVSLAAFSREEKLDGSMDWTDELVLEAIQIKHPLIQPEHCVSNDLKMKVDKKIILLTGANMSGKTTFMRTLGINLVMVNLGLNPMGKHLLCGPFQLFTSMRNIDNLGESISSFYAELSRIKKLLSFAEKGEPVFFLLDEILKGTNTTDRVMGSEALIRQLSDSNCKGIISTHDIELSQLEEKILSLANFSFHSDIQEDQINFDYKIKPGPCPNFNAHKLMELMGIRFIPHN